MNMSRCRVLVERAKEKAKSDSTVLYWVSRDLRAEHNWALLHAQDLAIQSNASLAVLYVLTPNYERYTWRHYHFLTRSLRELDEDLRRKNIPFFVVEADQEDVPNAVEGVLDNLRVSTLVCDMTPTRSPTTWLRTLVNQLKSSPRGVEVRQVDAHNIIPIWIASQKLEWAARTIRPKIHSGLNVYLDVFPSLQTMPPLNASLKLDKLPFPSKDLDTTNYWTKIESESRTMTTCDRLVEPVDSFFPPGTKSALARLDAFLCKEGIGQQSTRRNDPNYTRVSSGISPYLNFGLISAQYIVQRVHEFDAATGKKYHKDCETYLEELVVRRELSDNFCFYNQLYDSLEGAPEWAQITLKHHIPDRREHVYTFEQWEDCATHDPIWNASMMQLRKEGKMHGFLRMYWAKKMLEWSASPQEALDFAIRLNDRWAVDGNDNPNGFVGIMWSICGVHDQGFGERAVYGKIRYMNDSGCKRKFDVKAFCARYPVHVPPRPHAVLDKPSSTKAKKRGSVEALIEAHNSRDTSKKPHAVGQ